MITTLQSKLVLTKYGFILNNNEENRFYFESLSVMVVKERVDIIDREVSDSSCGSDVVYGVQGGTNMKFYEKFGFKLIRNILIIGLVPLFITMIISYNASKNVIEDEVNALNKSIVQGYKSTIFGRMEGASSAIEIMANIDLIKSMNPQEMEGALLELLNKNEVISQLYVMDTTGMQIYKTSGELGDRSTREYFLKAIEGQANYSDVIISGTTGLPIIVYAAPIVNESGTVGVLGASIDLSFVSSLIASDDPDAYAFIVDGNGIIIAHPDETLIEDQVNLMELTPVQEVTQGKEGSSEYSYQGESKLASYVFLDFARWGLIYQESTDSAFSEINKMLRLYLIIGILTIFIVVVGAMFIARMVNEPISDLESKMSMASQGKLNVEMSPKQMVRKDEFGHLTRNFDGMIKALNGLLTESSHLSDQVTGVANTLAQTTDQTRVLSNEITNAVDEIAKGASEQATESEKGVGITSSFSRKFDDLTKRSNAMNEDVQEILKMNEAGADKMKSLENASKDNVVTTSKVEASIKELKEQSASIAGILGTITSIAEQTNLLALNASIEAARAGENGRGFAVVADEIRKLAEGSKDATDQIGTIINSIQYEINNTVGAMAEVSTSTKFQSESVAEVDTTFKLINNSIESISGHVRDIDLSVTELNDENRLVVDSISTISAVTQETAAAAEEVLASVEQQYNAIESVAQESSELQGLASSLKAEIDKFEL